MACCNFKKRSYKSIQKVYNPNSQTVIDSGTTLNLLGTLATDTGVGITTNINNFSINCSGAYSVSFDVTVDVTTGGDAVLQIYKNGVPLPCAISTLTASGATIYTMHVETDLLFRVNDEITIQISGVTGNATFVSGSIIKLA